MSQDRAPALQPGQQSKTLSQKIIIKVTIKSQKSRGMGERERCVKEKNVTVRQREYAPVFHLAAGRLRLPQRASNSWKEDTEAWAT